MKAWLVDHGPCPYLDGRGFRSVVVEGDLGRSYRALMDAGFRRSGPVAYLPDCPGCSACVSVRVSVADFAPRRDQRRIWARNRDLTTTLEPRGDSAEREALWGRYQAMVHGQSEPGPPPGREPDGGVEGGELHARDGSGRLVAVSIVDLFPDALSSVYCYWDPDLAERGLGTWMALAEIDHARRTGRAWWYLGYWVSGCGKMAYKARYRPQQRLVDGAWRWVDGD
jgi:arginyl-tRNA--protein-N-Asp/Glu arginylyltransferase